MSQPALDMPEITFLDVYSHPGAYEFLWLLMGERKPEVNISHQGMPTWDQHVQFVDGKPYKSWHLIQLDGDIAGAVYLSKQSEIGIHVFARHQGRGIGRAAVLELMAWHPGLRLFANVAPFNEKSMKLFVELGFHLVEHTFKPRQGKLLYVDPGNHGEIERLQLRGCRLLQHTFAVDTPLVKMGKTYADR